MHNSSRPIGPVDRDINIWVRVLGVFGFMMLLGLFFVLGFYGIGQRLSRSQHQATPPPETTHRYVPPVPPRAEEEAPPKEEGPDIKLEVTEEGVDGIPAADDTEVEPPDEVFAEKPGKSDLTITLDGKEKQPANDKSTPTASEKDRPTAAPEKPKSMTPEKPATTKPSTTQTKGAETSKAPARSTLEKPRAATEKGQVVYRVQAGSYADRSHADSLAAKLKAEGYRRTTITQSQVNGRTLYRVQVAEYKTSLDAEELSKDLKATGYKPAVVTAEKPR